jgi:predicted ATP-dependent endonuclease of OLD family
MREVSWGELQPGVEYIIEIFEKKHYTLINAKYTTTRIIRTFVKFWLPHYTIFRDNRTQKKEHVFIPEARFFLPENGDVINRRYENDDIINRRAIRAFAQYPPTNRLPQSMIDLTKSFIKKESDSSAGSADSMRVNKDRSYNAEVNRNSFELPSSNYDESDELDRMNVYVAPTYGPSRRAGIKGKRRKGTLKKKKKNKK